MLTNLSIKNYALIEDISLDFNKGMTVITGETGAGKSIIIQAVDLLLGARASASSIRTGGNVCSLSACFDISKNPAAQKMLEELAIEHDGEIIVRRNLDVSGKSKAFINDMPVSVSGLYDIGRLLIDFYSQHKSNMLFDGNYQRQIIDDVAENAKLIKRLNEKYLYLTNLLNKKNSLMLSQSEKERMADLYNFQLQEITKADLRADEEIKIEAELPKLKNAEKIHNLAAEIANNLYKQDKSVLESLSKTIKQIDMLGQLGIDTEILSKTINEAFIQIDDIYREINNISQNIDVNPAALNNMLEKQQLIKKLKSKYSRSVEDILKYKEELAGKIKELTDYDFNLISLEKEIDAAKKETELLCEKISDARKSVSKKLAKDIVAELEDLNMKNVQFEIAIQKQEISAYGFDKIEFMFCANKGETIYPLAEVASGGELSRVMLAIAASLSRYYQISTMIFDEIDTGTSGQTSQKIGKKLKKISYSKQIILVSHQAQIASNADTHISIYKESVNNRNITKAKVLNQDEHIKEIAKIISGEKVTEHALKHAKEMTLQ